MGNAAFCNYLDNVTAALAQQGQPVDLSATDMETVYINIGYAVDPAVCAAEITVCRDAGLTYETSAQRQARLTYNTARTWFVLCGTAVRQYRRSGCKFFPFYAKIMRRYAYAMQDALDARLAYFAIR